MPAVYSYDVIEVKRRTVISASSPEEAIDKAKNQPEAGIAGTRWESIELSARRTDVVR